MLVFTIRLFYFILKYYLANFKIKKILNKNMIIFLKIKDTELKNFLFPI